MTRHSYTAEERAFIEKSYATMSRVEIADALGLPEVSIKLFIQRNKHIRKGRPKSCFKPGNEPWNTGVKGWVRKSAESDYKPGNVPHNATDYYDGMVVVRHKRGEKFPYCYRRISKGKWVLSHRYNWEQLHGPIPAGHILNCIDGDTLNDDATNWEPITYRAIAEKNGIWGENKASAALTPAYLAATLTRNQPALRRSVLDCPQLLEIQRLKITLNRALSHGMD